MPENHVFKFSDERSYLRLFFDLSEISFETNRNPCCR